MGKLDAFATGSHFAKDGVDAALVDDAHAFGREAQADESTLGGYPELVRMQIGQKTPATTIFRVRYIVAGHGTLAGYLAHSGHGNYSEKFCMIGETARWHFHNA